MESDFLWNVVSEGIVVWGKPEDIISKEPHPSLKPLVEVSYSIEGLSEAEKRRLLRRLYTSKNKLFDEFHVKYSLKKVWWH